VYEGRVGLLRGIRAYNNYVLLDRGGIDRKQIIQQHQFLLVKTILYNLQLQNSYVYLKHYTM
jgi:hypothetical protein